MSEQLQPMPDDWQRGLVIVAHPDDIEFGGAAAVAVWTAQGKEISYLLVTRGEAGIEGMAPEQAGPAREAEQRASAAIVGVSSVEFLDYRDGVIEPGMKLRRELVAAIRRHRPELLITLNHHDDWGPGSWNTPDHRVVGRTLLDASGDAGNRWIFTDLADKDLEPWTGLRWVAIAGSPRPSHAIDVSAGVESGIASLAAHRVYLEGLTDKPADDSARAWLEQGFAMHSARFGGVPTVAFELISR
jgi:LmbE family N-acetylglucosaminyl deacetylase